MRLSRLILATLLIIPTAGWAKPNPTTETLTFLRQSWSLVSKDGPKALNAAKLHWPDQVRRVKDEVSTLQSKCDKGVSQLGLTEKVALVGELWRVRSSINLLALLDPQMLHNVTGLDPKALDNLRKQAETLRTRVRI